MSDEVTGWFDPLYEAADGDPAAVPWARQEPHPGVVAWLDQPGLELDGVDACVVGCGLGDDAAELARRGCRVTAFDVSPTAVEWAQRRFPDLDIEWRVADLFDLPADLRASAGLVVEVRTVQSLPAIARDAAMQAIASLVADGGYLVAMTLLATSDDIARGWDGPPWALAPSELAAYRAAGLQRVELDHPDAPRPDGAMEIRLTYHRPETPPTPQAM